MPNRFLFVGYLYLGALAALPIEAQIVGDGTTQTFIETADNINFTISGGQLIDSTLFHRFSDFSIPEAGSATFGSVSDVQTIVGQVTGSSVSSIDGTLRVVGPSDLILVNPNGIIFGQNSSLDLNGSFLASTAREIITERQSLEAKKMNIPLLEIDLPIGLQFGDDPGSIIYRSSASSVEDEPRGLQVPPRQTLALIGGDVLLENASFSTTNGTIIINSFSDEAFVVVSKALGNWKLSQREDAQLGAINIFGMSKIEVLATGFNEGMIQLISKDIIISDRSQLFSLNLGSSPGIQVNIVASDSFELSSGSNIRSDALSEGSAGNVMIDAGDMLLIGASTIGTTSQSIAAGAGGNITLDIGSRLEIKKGSQITSQSFGSGNTGSIEVDAKEILMEEVGQFTNSTFGSGNGGRIFVKADLIEIRGGIDEESKTRSGIFSRTLTRPQIDTSTRPQTATGDGGEIVIEAGRLTLQEGAVITVASENGSQGGAGEVSIVANSIDIRGDGSSISGISGSEKPSGDLTIETNDLTLSNKGEISVEAVGSGPAGTLEIKAKSITLTDQSLLNASTQGGEGNIVLQVEGPISLRRGSGITTDARGDATGGNIIINGDVLTALEDSDITANAERGGAGNITITAQGLFIDGEIFDQDNPAPVDPEGRPIDTPSSDIIASSQFGQQGQVEITNPDTDPTQGVLQPTTVSPPPQITQGCSSTAQVASFVNVGSGGTGSDPTGLLSDSSTWVDLDLPNSWLRHSDSLSKSSDSVTRGDEESKLNWGFTPGLKVAALEDSFSTLFRVWCSSDGDPTPLASAE